MAQEFQRMLMSLIEAVNGIKGRRRNKDKAFREAWRPKGKGTTQRKDKTTRLQGYKAANHITDRAGFRLLCLEEAGRRMTTGMRTYLSPREKATICLQSGFRGDEVP